jgi:hypothetical protein
VEGEKVISRNGCVATAGHGKAFEIGTQELRNSGSVKRHETKRASHLDGFSSRMLVLAPLMETLSVVTLLPNLGV